MRSARSVAAAVKWRLIKRKLPFIKNLKDFEKSGVKFNVNNAIEHLRVVGHGGETEYTSAMLQNLRPNDILFDVGANVGMVALHAASICRTIAFEPDPLIRRRLEANAALNPDRTLEIEGIAISDSDGVVDLYTDGDAGNSPSLVHQRGERGRVSVSSRSIDSIIDEGTFPRPTVIKLDIEGAEILALRGATRLLASSNRPRALFIEVHNTFLPGFGSSAEEVLELLNGHGYTHTEYSAQRDDQLHLILSTS
jgi:FkbM family methyltransferase